MYSFRPWENEVIFYMKDFQWKLDVPYWEISDETKDLLMCADMLQDRAMSIRGAAREFGIPKSTLHSFIHGELKSVCSELYGLCKRQLEWNSRNSQSFMKFPVRRRYR